MEGGNVVGDFIVKNIKSILTVIVFACSLYVQYQSSMMKIERLENDLNVVRAQVESQYVKLDNMKLDKAVFEATMKQFTDISTDVREIRERLEDVLADHQYHQSSHR